MNDLDALDRALLERMQAGFPLVPRPFALLGAEVGLGESDVLARVRRSKEAGLIRQIGAVFDTRRLGYQSTLIAFHTQDDRLEDVAAQVSAHPGVSHNYARPHHYNLWFTLAVPPGCDLEVEIHRLARQAGVDDWLNLPALRMFKIQTHFRLAEGQQSPGVYRKGPATTPRRSLSREDVVYVRALQQDLPLVSRPFAEMARQWGLCEDALLIQARELEAEGIMRRFSAVLRHRNVGYTANGMACWIVPDFRMEEVGPLSAAYPQVSHCYQRPAHPPRWPYTLFTMIHGRSRDEVEMVVSRIAQETRIDHYTILYSTREFKKERVRYFAEET